MFVVVLVANELSCQIKAKAIGPFASETEAKSYLNRVGWIQDTKRHETAFVSDMEGRKHLLAFVLPIEQLTR